MPHLTLEILHQFVRHSFFPYGPAPENLRQRLEGGQVVIGRSPLEPPAQQVSEAGNGCRVSGRRRYSVQLVLAELERHSYLPPLGSGIHHKIE